MTEGGREDSSAFRGMGEGEALVGSDRRFQDEERERSRDLPPHL